MGCTSPGRRGGAVSAEHLANLLQQSLDARTNTLAHLSNKSVNKFTSDGKDVVAAAPPNNLIRRTVSI
jgi:hypothetical protein